MNAHVAIIMGGTSAEREVSIVTGKAVEEALVSVGYKVTTIDANDSLAEKLINCSPDIVFNALHGKIGEDGCVQGLLETLQIPYTHSGVLASAIAMNKPVAKRLFKEAGLQCPEGRVLNIDELSGKSIFKPPYVIKPLREGSSVGVFIIDNKNSEPLFSLDKWCYGSKVLVEEFIPGREIQDAIMGQKALGAIEIRPKGSFYDYETKYTVGRAQHFMPAPIHPRSYQEALDIALRAHRALDCRGVSRADLRYNDTNGEPGKLYLLEVNTQPGLTPLSLVPEIAADNGITFSELVSWMVENASCDN